MKLRLLIFFFLSSASYAQQNKALTMISAMIDSVHSIQTVRFKVMAVERVQNKYNKVVSENKIQISPRKLYLVNKEKKLEILYISGQNNNKAIVKPNVFPYLTLTLDPHGSLMRKNQHYSIHELGFDFIAKAIEWTIAKEREVNKDKNLTGSLNYLGMQMKNGYKCHLIVYETKAFSYKEYIVQEKETVASIASKFCVNDYILRSKNDLFFEFDYLKKGMKIMVPVFYCKKAVFFIEEKTMLPVGVSVFDDVGLLENYDFTNIILNKPIDPAEFKKDYKDYHF